MSTKSRKKSSKAAPRQSVRAKSSKAAKTRSVKTSRTAASKPIVKATPEASHKAASKRLISSDSATPAKKRSTQGSAVDKPPAAAEGTKGAIKEGGNAPAFRLPRDGGAELALSDFAGRKLVLFFYPRADTPGCTREAIDFSRLRAAFAESKTEVVGVSADPVKTQESFRDKHGLSVPLISDATHAMLDAYGAWGEKSMYGKTFQGILRTTVLIGSDGRIARIWRKVKVDGHADAVLEAARAL
jgi:thioredoxin-dependent peroxiredoxin